MVISSKMNDAIGKQINRELYSSYLYLQMAVFFKTRNLDGFAHWLKLQAEEEKEHALKFFDYVLERGGDVKLLPIEAPEAKWKSPVEVFEEVYAHEQKVTQMIGSLVEAARAEKDYASEEMLNWFVKEQVEEESNASSILEKLKLIKDSVGGLYQLDHHLGKRQGD
jgi:ferritin